MIILDTHVWLWFMSQPETLSIAAQKAIDASDTIGITAISCWEVAMLTTKRRIELDRSAFAWVQEALLADRVLLLDFTPHIAVVAAELEWDHRDPADRIIAATGVVHDAAIVTKDRRIQAFQDVTTIW